ncbi:hypothetical protein C1I89_31415 [Achromobacter pulmonis]|uniref:Phasin domain-containing protein n=1 Tax=Achromobacter pulmonis TaxID=1389932 RepID=A0A2N8K9F3_9BURK|nr:phasin family protein [Achromobacter pulmonis]MBO9332979.1 hypothetical protein [Achromobacter xylosoxidans]PND30089.1 hypothetical protein C1I89_31415 [Achromobacter pulmonis]
MNADTLSLGFFKANAELQLRLAKLTQECGQRWLESVVKAGKDGMAESTAQIESLLKAENWQALATLPSQTFWRVFQQRVTDTQALNQLAIENQAALTRGLQQAIQEWQQVTIESASKLGSAQPLLDVFNQWGAKWAEAASTVTGAQSGDASRGK